MGLGPSSKVKAIFSEWSFRFITPIPNPDVNRVEEEIDQMTNRKTIIKEIFTIIHTHLPSCPYIVLLIMDARDFFSHSLDIALSPWSRIG